MQYEIPDWCPYLYKYHKYFTMSNTNVFGLSQLSVLTSVYFPSHLPGSEFSICHLGLVDYSLLPFLFSRALISIQLLATLLNILEFPFIQPACFSADVCWLRLWCLSNSGLGAFSKEDGFSWYTINGSDKCGVIFPHLKVTQIDCCSFDLQISCSLPEWTQRR